MTSEPTTPAPEEKPSSESAPEQMANVGDVERSAEPAFPGDARETRTSKQLASTPDTQDTVRRGGQDSATFSRCAGCKYSAEVNQTAGTLACEKYDMRIDAEADEIPDDCVAYEPAGG